MEIIIKKEFVKEALEYSKLSKSFTSDTHDFHEGGLNAKQRKMFEGKLGEKGIKQFFIENNIDFKEDESSHKDADEYAMAGNYYTTSKAGLKFKKSKLNRTFVSVIPN